VCIGDVYRIGGASIQASTPRGPCFKIGFHWNRPDLVKRVEATGRHGWYVLVLAEGPVEAGQEFTLQERPNPAWTVAHTANVYRNRSKDRTAALELAAVGELMPRVRQELRAAYLKERAPHRVRMPLVSRSGFVNLTRRTSCARVL
jgi:MOSC domain-containing protein YiiM